jgi:hypothetical protein
MAALLCTRKDFLKLPRGAAERHGIAPVDREIALPEGLWGAVDRHRASVAASAAAALPPVGNLVH